MRPWFPLYWFSAYPRSCNQKKSMRRDFLQKKRIFFPSFTIISIYYHILPYHYNIYQKKIKYFLIYNFYIKNLILNKFWKISKVMHVVCDCYIQAAQFDKLLFLYSIFYKTHIFIFREKYCLSTKQRNQMTLTLYAEISHRLRSAVSYFVLQKSIMI